MDQVQVRRTAGILLTLTVGAFLITQFRAGQWSLWEDEETTVYYALNLDKWFARFSPVYFHPLGSIFKHFGVSAWHGRLLSAVCGSLTVGVMFVGFRRWIGDAAAIIAAVLLATSLGHLFWCQSIRYYTMAVLFETLSLALFFRGFESNNAVSILLAGIAWGGGLLSHQSAVFIGPVFIAYGVLLRAFEADAFRIRSRAFLSAIAMVICVGGLFSFQLRSMHRYQSAIQEGSPSTDTAHLLLTVIAYFGIPIILLGIGGVWKATRISIRVRLFLAICAWLPIVQLLVVAVLNLINTVTWYYGLISLVASSLLAGLFLSELFTSGRRKLAVSFASATAIYAAAFLSLYFGPMHGDRPRWKDAAEYLIQEVSFDKGIPHDAIVYGTVTGVLEYYLGVDPSTTMDTHVVQPMPSTPPQISKVKQQWFVVKHSHVTESYWKWFRLHCELKAQFEAHTGPRDRTVLVFQCVDRKTVQALTTSKR